MTGVPAAAPLEVSAKRGLMRDALRRHPTMIIGLALLLGMILMAIFAPLITPYNPEAQSFLTEALAFEDCEVTQFVRRAQWVQIRDNPPTSDAERARIGDPAPRVATARTLDDGPCVQPAHLFRRSQQRADTRGTGGFASDCDA